MRRAGGELWAVARPPIPRCLPRAAGIGPPLLPNHGCNLCHHLSRQDDYEKGTFHFMELYTSQAAMADHNRLPEFAQFVDKASARGEAAAVTGDGCLQYRGRG